MPSNTKAPPRKPIFTMLPPALIAKLDSMARKEQRSRSKMVEVLIKQAVEDSKRAA